MLIELTVLFASSLIVGYSGALVPGPVLAVTVHETTRKGFRAGFSVPIGHSVIELLLVVLLTFGLAEVLSLKAVTGAVGLFGGSFLLWMAYRMLRRAVKDRVSFKVTSEGSHFHTSSMVSGIYSSVSNPYWLLWWASVGAGFLLRSLEFGLLGITAFYVGHILSDITWYGMVAFLIGKGRMVLSGSRYRALLVLCGLPLILFGIFFIDYGLSFVTSP